MDSSRQLAATGQIDPLVLEWSEIDDYGKLTIPNLDRLQYLFWETLYYYSGAKQ